MPSFSHIGFELIGDEGDEINVLKRREEKRRYILTSQTGYLSWDRDAAQYDTKHILIMTHSQVDFGAVFSSVLRFMAAGAIF